MEYKGQVINDAVSWDAETGIYVSKIIPPGASDHTHTELILHFTTQLGSCRAVQYKTQHANSGIYYRSARDDKGFEMPWTKLASMDDIPQNVLTADDLPKVTTGSSAPSNPSKGDIFIKL